MKVPMCFYSRLQSASTLVTSHNSQISHPGHPSRNQRTSGPVNAHLTPGPGIYFNAFKHVYSPRAGADNPLGTNVDVNRKPLSLCPFVASFKTISLKYDFKHILNGFIHVFSPRAETDNPLGTKFWCQQKFFITLFVASLKKKSLWGLIFLLLFVFIPGAGADNSLGSEPIHLFSCDPDPANQLSFPYPTEVPYEMWLWLAQWFWRRRSLKMVDGRTTDGWTTDHGYTISSPMSLKAQVS